MSEQGVAPAGDAGISARDAVALINAPVEDKKPDTNSESAAPQEAEASPQESAQEADAGPAQEPVPGETEDADPADDSQPSIEPPRSWSKEHKDAFAALPRHLQEAVSESERAREADFLNRQRAAAESQKALEAREQAAEQARQQYEQALPQLLLQIDAEYQQEFGNATWPQIEEWSRTEPDKYLRWDASYKRLQAVASEHQTQQQRQLQQAQFDRERYIEAQTKLLAEKVPELADQKVMDAKRGDYLSYLGDVGFTQDELAYHAKSLSPSISLHDHRLTLLIHDAMRFRAAEKAAKKASKDKPDVPPVQRPGSPPQKGEAKQARLQDLGKQLERSHSAKDAARLIAALR